VSARSDYISIEVDGQRIDTWTEYRVVSDMLTPADAFTLVLELGVGRGERARDEWARARELCAPNATVRLYVGADVHGGDRRRALQLTGIIDDRIVEGDRQSGTRIRIEGRDLARHLCDSSVPVSLVREQAAGGTFIDLARAAVQPWGIEVISDPAAARDIMTGAAGLTPALRLEVEQMTVQGISRRHATAHVLRRAQIERKPLDEATGTTVSDRARRRSSSGLAPSDIERQRISEASPRAGETVWSFLQRHAERLHIMMWMSPRGQLILGYPDYGQDPKYRFVRRFTNDPDDPNNAAAMAAKDSGADRWSKVTVYGRAHGQDVSRARVRAVVEDTSLPFAREKVEHLQDCTTVEQATSAAKRIMREGVASAHTLTVMADDHGQGRYLYAPNTVAEIVDEYSDIDERRFITQRTFMRTRDRGTHTELELIPLNSLTL